MREVRRPEPVQSAPEPSRRVDDRNDARFDGARLVALQMAVAGGSREEVEVHLERNFDVNDLKSILNDVFGEDGGEPEPVARSGPGGGAA